MSEEIKEILDDIQLLDFSADSPYNLTRYELSKVLEYITNLQTRIKELEAINEEHRKINGELRKTINEAIEYINKAINNKNWANDNFQDIYGPQLLDILQGSDKE